MMDEHPPSVCGMAAVSISGAVQEQLAEIPLDTAGGAAVQTYPPQYPPLPEAGGAIDGTISGLPDTTRNMMEVYKVRM